MKKDFILEELKPVDIRKTNTLYMSYKDGGLMSLDNVMFCLTLEYDSSKDRVTYLDDYDDIITEDVQRCQPLEFLNDPWEITDDEDEVNDDDHEVYNPDNFSNMIINVNKALGDEAIFMFKLSHDINPILKELATILGDDYEYIA